MDLYSNRKAKEQRAKDGIHDVFQYQLASAKIRHQFAMIMVDVLGLGIAYEMYEQIPNKKYEAVRSILLREYGKFHLSARSAPSFEDLGNFVLNSTTDEFLDVVELVLNYASSTTSSFYKSEKISAHEAISETNHRFREDGFGYRFENGRIVRIDSEHYHSDVVKPAIALLHASGFEKANEDFMLSHEHYRHGRNKDAIVSANRAFESAMKAVCVKKRWAYSEKARASDLVKLLKANQFWPAYVDKSIDQLLSVLSSGLPEVRNNAGGHGEGNTSPEVSSAIVQYALNLCAANILLLVETLNG